ARERGIGNADRAIDTHGEGALPQGIFRRFGPHRDGDRFPAMLLDEPKRGLDGVLIRRIEDRLRRIADEPPRRGIDAHRERRVRDLLDTDTDFHTGGPILSFYSSRVRGARGSVGGGAGSPVSDYASQVPDGTKRINAGNCRELTDPLSIRSAASA